MLMNLVERLLCGNVVSCVHTFHRIYTMTALGTKANQGQIIELSKSDYL